MQKLKLCPFCDGEGSLCCSDWDFENKRPKENTRYEVECNECLCSTDKYKTEREAIEAWNTRKSEWLITDASAENRMNSLIGMHKFEMECMRRELKRMLEDNKDLRSENAILKYRYKSKQWISTKDKLPPNGDELVLVVVHGYREDIVPMNAVEIGSYTSEDGWILEAFPELENMQITHWLPLPEPPKE